MLTERFKSETSHYNKMDSGKKRGVILWTIIAICFFAAITYIATGLITIFKSDILQKMPGFETLGSSPGLLIPKGIFAMLLGLIFFTITIGLFKTKWWARLVLIIFAGIQIVSYLWLIINRQYLNSKYLTFIGLGIYLALIFYLLFSKRIKENFKQI